MIESLGKWAFPVPVREAVRRLEAEGLVEFQRNVGAIVSGVDTKDYAVTMETMAVLEGYATALSIPHLTEEDLAEAEELNSQMRDMLRDSFDPRQFTTLNNRFHRILTHRTTNHRLFDLLEREWERITIIRRSAFAFDPRYSMRSVDEHAQIIELIREGAPSTDVEFSCVNTRCTMRQYISVEHKPRLLKPSAECAAPNKLARRHFFERSFFELNKSLARKAFLSGFSRVKLDIIYETIRLYDAV